MNNPISIFIMDVSNSSLNNNGEELTNYLDELVNWIGIWTKDIYDIKIKHRSGDEIIFAGNDYATAYTIAFFISLIWRYADHRPYFGLAFGDIEKNMKEIDIEKWIHPIIKQARHANNLLKDEQKRQQFKFELDQFYLNDLHSYHRFRSEFESLFNTLLDLQQKYIWNQTEIQKLVCSWFFILGQQKAVGELLGKSAPTISTHLKKGNSDEILHTYYEITNILISLQQKSYPNSKVNLKERNEILCAAIRKHLKGTLAK